MTDLGIIVTAAVVALAAVASCAMLSAAWLVSAWWQRAAAADDWALSAESLDMAREQMDAGAGMPDGER